MVIRHRPMSLIWQGVLWSALTGPTDLAIGSVENPQTPRNAPGPDRTVRSALGQGAYPWYDAENDQVRPINLPEAPKLSNSRGLDHPLSGWKWGDYLVFGGFVASLSVLVGLVFRFWKRFEPIAGSDLEPGRSTSEARAREVLPAGLRRDESTETPWLEANRRRLEGDYAGAIRCLFIHQLLTLSRLNLVRLAPGRTGRQLHRAVADPEFRTLMTPTLRQFEAVYYGHRTPTQSDFAAVWTSAEAFERRAAGGVAG